MSNEKKRIAKGIPQKFINVFNIVDYSKLSIAEQHELSKSLKILINGFSDFPKHEKAVDIMNGDLSSLELADNIKITKDVPQEVLNVISAIKFNAGMMKFADEMAEKLKDHCVANFPLKANWKSLFNVQ